MHKITAPPLCFPRRLGIGAVQKLGIRPRTDLTKALLLCFVPQHRPEQGAGEPSLHEAGSDRLCPQAAGGQHVWAGPWEAGPDQSLPDPEQLQTSGQVRVPAHDDQDGQETKQFILTTLCCNSSNAPIFIIIYLFILKKNIPFFFTFLRYELSIVKKVLD